MLSVCVSDNSPNSISDRYPLIKISRYHPQTISNMFCNNFRKNMEIVVAGNIDRDMHTYAYAYFDGASPGSSAFHARIIDAIFLTFACTEVVYSYTWDHS